MGACTCSKSVTLKPTTTNSSFGLPKFRYFRRDLGKIVEIIGHNAKVLEGKNLRTFPTNSAIGFDSESTLLIAGGSNSEGRLTADFTKVNLLHMDCKSCDPLPVPCKFGNLLVEEDHVYYVGGYQNTDEIPLYYYDKNLKKWRKIHPLGNADVKRLIYPGAFIRNKKIYFLGGQLGTHKKIVSNFNVYSLDLTNFECVKEDIRFPLALNGTLCFNKGDDVIVVGGWAPSDISKVNKNTFCIKPDNEIIKESNLPWGITENYPVVSCKSLNVACSYPNLAILGNYNNKWLSYELKIKKYEPPEDNRMQFEERDDGVSSSSHSISAGSSFNKSNSEFGKRMSNVKGKHVHEDIDKYIPDIINDDNKEPFVNRNMNFPKKYTAGSFEDELVRNLGKGKQGTRKENGSSSSNSDEKVIVEEPKLKKAFYSSGSWKKSDIIKVKDLENKEDSSGPEDDVLRLPIVESESYDSLDEKYNEIMGDSDKKHSEKSNSRISMERKTGKKNIEKTGEKKYLEDRKGPMGLLDYYRDTARKSSSDDEDVALPAFKKKKSSLKLDSQLSGSDKHTNELIYAKKDLSIESSSNEKEIKRNRLPKIPTGKYSRENESNSSISSIRKSDSFMKIPKPNVDSRKLGTEKDDKSSQSSPRGLRKVPLGSSSKNLDKRAKKDPEIKPKAKSKAKVELKSTEAMNSQLNLNRNSKSYSKVEQKMNPGLKTEVDVKLTTEVEPKLKAEHKLEPVKPNIPHKKLPDAKEKSQSSSSEDKRRPKDLSQDDDFSSDSVPSEVQDEEIPIVSKVSKITLYSRSDSNSSNKDSKRQKPSEANISYGNRKLEVSYDSKNDSKIKYPQAKIRNDSSSSDKHKAIAYSGSEQKIDTKNLKIKEKAKELPSDRDYSIEMKYDEPIKPNKEKIEIKPVHKPKIPPREVKNKEEVKLPKKILEANKNKGFAEDEKSMKEISISSIHSISSSEQKANIKDKKPKDSSDSDKKNKKIEIFKVSTPKNDSSNSSIKIGSTKKPPSGANFTKNPSSIVKSRRSSSSSDERKPIKIQPSKINKNQPVTDAPVFQLKARIQESSSSEDESVKLVSPKFGKPDKNQSKRAPSVSKNTPNIPKSPAKDAPKLPNSISKNSPRDAPIIPKNSPNFPKDSQNAPKNAAKILNSNQNTAAQVNLPNPMAKMSDSSDKNPRNKPSNLSSKNAPVIKINLPSGSSSEEDRKNQKFRQGSSSSSSGDEAAKGVNIRGPIIPKQRIKPPKNNRGSSSSSSRVQSKAPKNPRRIKDSRDLGSSSSDSNPKILRGGRN